jgi:hypothetical protein
VKPTKPDCGEKTGGMGSGRSIARFDLDHAQKSAPVVFIVGLYKSMTNETGQSGVEWES